MRGINTSPDPKLPRAPVRVDQDIEHAQPESLLRRAYAIDVLQRSADLMVTETIKANHIRENSSAY